MSLPLLESVAPEAAPVPLEAQLAELARCGIRLCADITVADLLVEVPREELEAEPYQRLLHLLGSRGRSDDVWSFDLGSIGQPGSFARAAARLRNLAKGELPLEAIRDGETAGLAWVEFRLDGQTVRYETELVGDWSDLMPVFYIAEELEARGGERRFTWLEDGRFALVGCATPRQLSRLRTVTGLEIEWWTE